MARANIARREGDDFQARMFWLKAAALLDPANSVIKVAFEQGPKGFDDITIDYNPANAPQDHEGNPILRRHIQCKWHTTAGVFGFEDLVVPAFINAPTVSLLQRARAAQLGVAPQGYGCRIELVTNWRLKPGNPLMDLVRKGTDALDLNLLFDGTTDRSRMGQVRKLWREHLQVQDDDLKFVARVLAVAESSESLVALRDRLDERFASVGLKRVPLSQAGFPYDDLIFKLLSQGRVEFDRTTFRTMCQQEGLLAAGVPRDKAPTIGVRSFMHPIDSLEDRCDRMLNLVPYFDGRYIRDAANWQSKVHPELRDFLLKEARSSDHLRLVLDAHVSLAFATGAILNVKSGKKVEIEQRTQGRRFWSAQDEPESANWPRFAFRQETMTSDAPGIAVAVSLTHDVADATRQFVGSRLPEVGRLLQCTLASGPSQTAVSCGHHAWILVESVAKELRRMMGDCKGSGPVHLFIAGPNGFTFFLGQHQQSLGRTLVYEWDFDGQRGGGYSLGLSVV